MLAKVRLWRFIRRFAIFSLVFIVIATWFLSFTSKPASPVWKMQKLATESGHRGCIIPVIQPPTTQHSRDNETIRGIKCKTQHRPNPVFSRNGSVHVQFEENKERKKPRIKCEFVPVKTDGDFQVFLPKKEARPLPNGASPCPNFDSDAFEVTCREQTKKRKPPVFQSLMRCIVPKKDVTETLKSIKIEKPFSRFNERLNIFMLGLDSVSRPVFLSELQETAAFLSSELESVTFEGYNIIGDGTTAAFLGFTTGHYEQELHEGGRGFNGSKPLDDYPFIWSQLRKEAGYVTLWHEDEAGTGTFHNRLLGFEKPPVDYYGRHYQLALERYYEKKDFDCLGSLSVYEEMLSLFDQLSVAYPDPVRKFALVFSGRYTLTNRLRSSSSSLRAIDPLTANALKELNNRHLLNETALIMFADHGSRFGDSRNSDRGKLDERLPYLSIALPRWFRKKYPNETANLEIASRKLTTPFDLYKTLLDLTGVAPEPGVPAGRAISFFDKFPDDRNCEDAQVLPHWCTCLSDDATSSSTPGDPLIGKCIGEFVTFVNENLLKSFKNECHPILWSSGKVSLAKRLALRREVAQFKKTLDRLGLEPVFDDNAHVQAEFLQISFATQPGNAQWEVTFEHHLESGQISVNEKQISRINRYGAAPKCIQDKFPNLREYCYCK